MLEVAAARRAGVVAALVVVVGCAPAQDPTGTGGSDTEGPQPSRAPTPTAAPAATASPRGVAITGTLGADEVEGGCAYLETADGTRYEVEYPDGWTIEAVPLRLTAPDGEVVARSDDQVTVRGAVAREGRSICQIGPIFEATSVRVDD